MYNDTEIGEIMAEKLISNIENLDSALAQGMDDIQSIYGSLNKQAKQLVAEYTAPIDRIIKQVNEEDIFSPLTFLVF